MPSTDVLPRLVATDTDGLKSYIAWAVTCHGPSVDLNHIDVSAIRDMSLLFSNSPFNGNISDWNVSNVTNMNGMFERSAFNGDISRWNTAHLRSAAFRVSFSKSSRRSDLAFQTLGQLNQKDALCLFARRCPR